MEKISLAAAKRNVTGKAVLSVRKSGKLPAVLYGRGLDSTTLEVSEKDFLKAFKKAGESTIINLEIDGKNLPVLIQEVQNHYLTDRPIHVDFYAVRMDEELKATVPLHFVGEAPAVKSLNGILAKNVSEVEVECLPADLPSSIDVDISGLGDFETLIRVSDLKISGKVKVLTSADEVVVKVDPPRTEEELKSLEEKPVEADVSAVEKVAAPEAAEGEAEAGAEPKAKE